MFFEKLFMYSPDRDLLINYEKQRGNNFIFPTFAGNISFLWNSLSQSVILHYF
jgi:hypothetical protein